MVFAATIAALNSIVFGVIWRYAYRISPPNGSIVAYIVSSVLDGCTALVCAFIFYHIGVNALDEAVIISLLIWIGFALPEHIQAASRGSYKPRDFVGILLGRLGSLIIISLTLVILI